MRKVRASFVAVMLASAALAVLSPVSAQEKEKLKGRLPMYYSKLSITEAQRESIYKIQAGYETKIDKLEADLKAMKEKRDGELRDVLTKAQLKLLDETAEESKEKAKSKTKTAGAKTEEKMEKTEKTVTKKQ